MHASACLTVAGWRITSIRLQGAAFVRFRPKTGFTQYREWRLGVFKHQCTDLQIEAWP